METKRLEIAGHRVQWDASGVGHCWRDIEDLPEIVRLEIEGEIVDGGLESGEILASNGQRYRWS